MKKNLYLLICLFTLLQATSQSPRTAVVEHFTNSVCSICASKNPAFYNTLSNYPQVLHISFYPSSPYNYCFFSVQNKQENDDRTKYYGAYGATPQVAVNGKLLPITTPILNNTTLDTVLGQTSPVEVRVTEQLVTADSVQVSVTVKTTEANTYSNVKLFAGVAEEPINKTTNNGETVHHDVFRKALTAVTGNDITLPAVNDSMVYQFAYKAKNDWVVNNIYTMAYIQLAGTKEIVNAGKSTREIATGIDNVEQQKLMLFPNPAADKLYITGIPADGRTSYSVLDITGKKVSEGKISTTEINITGLAPGIYFLKTGLSTTKFVKQ